MQVGLHDNADIHMAPAQFRINLQRIGRAGGILHVETNEVSEISRPNDDRIGQLETFPFVYFQPELRQFHRNVGIDFLSVKLVQQRSVSQSGASSLVQAMDVFAENVHRRPEAFAVQFAGHADGIFNRFAGDVPRRNPSYKGFREVG